MNLDLSAMKNKTVTAAVSGGMDSVALFHYIYSSKEKYNITLKAVNVEHNIRGESSLSDSEFVKKLCEKFNVPCLSYSVDAPLYSKENKMSLEAAARLLRYECFNKVLNSGSADFIATAHHMSDNAESVLFNLLRGSGLKGVSGIAREVKGILRPMLHVSKEEIENYIKKHNLSFVTDESNYDDSYTRNFIRLNVMPMLKKVFPSCENALTKFAKTAAEDNEFLQSLSEKLLVFEENCVKIEFCEQKPLFMRAVISAVSYMGEPFDYTSKQLLSVYLLQNKNNGDTVHLNNNLRAVRDYGKITFYKEQSLEKENEREDEPVYPFAFKTGLIKLRGGYFAEIAPFEEDISALKNSGLKTSGLVFDLEKIPDGAVMRRRLPGDIFTPCNGRTKSLKKYLIEKKVPERERDGLVVIAKENTVLAVLPLEISDIIKVDNNSKILYNVKTTKGEKHAQRH